MRRDVGLKSDKAASKAWQANQLSIKAVKDASAKNRYRTKFQSMFG
jgi:hypothetical protein